jgi:hypothetical protein
MYRHQVTLTGLIIHEKSLQNCIGFDASDEKSGKIV